ncbi:MAG: cardiolipin synthase [Planctomycetota bacterium]
MLTSILILVHGVVVLLVGTRLVMSRRPVGATLAWLYLVVLIPVMGAAAYLLIGENRVGQRRRRKLREKIGPYENWYAELSDAHRPEWGLKDAPAARLDRLAREMTGFPALAGNDLELLKDGQVALQRLRADIQAAKSTIFLEFYIWESHGLVLEIERNLEAASQRGVCCHILVDGVGSSEFLLSLSAESLRRAGVQIVETMPIGIMRSIVARLDHRNHRKIAVIDGLIAFTGSLNMADPVVLRKDEDVGDWVDCMVRLKGPVVDELALLFLSDWELETEEGCLDGALSQDLGRSKIAGHANALVLPSGPATSPDAIRDMLLTTIYLARDELVLTTPYFIPGEPLLAAIKAAARRGVCVKIIVPKQNDSLFVRLAAPAYFDELLEAGVEVFIYGRGLLHSKTICVDREFSVVGSVNLDLRSFHLNFEVSLFAFDEAFSKDLRELQNQYLAASEGLDLKSWMKRSWLRRLVEKIARLLSPLL